MNKNLCLIASSCIVALLSLRATFASDIPNVARIEQGQLTVETTHVYSRRVFSESKPVPLAGSGFSTRKTAEDTLLDYYKHLSKGDIDQAWLLWDKGSQNVLRARFGKQPKQELSETSRKMFANGFAKLTSTIEYGEFRIVEAIVLNDQGKVQVPSETMALVNDRDSGEWRLTHALADDPVMCCWNSKERRIRRIAVPGGEGPTSLRALIGTVK
jgi:hypothetical protein